MATTHSLAPAHLHRSQAFSALRNSNLVNSDCKSPNMRGTAAMDTLLRDERAVVAMVTTSTLSVVCQATAINNSKKLNWCSAQTTRSLMSFFRSM